MCRSVSGKKHNHRKGTQQTMSASSAFEATMSMFEDVVQDAGACGEDIDHELNLEEFEFNEDPEFEFDLGL